MNLVKLAKWILVVGGLVLAYEGFSGTDLVEATFGSFEMYVDIIVFGGAAVYLAYVMLMKMGKK
ncbi:MAG: hypothetical protein WD992_01610 [Candidatus Levyibacteriota bacterium]